MSFMSCRHAFKRVLRRIAAQLLFDRWSGRADADGTPLLHDFTAVTADHSLSTAAALALWEGARIRVTGSGAGEGSLYLVEAGGICIVI